MRTLIALALYGAVMYVAYLLLIWIAQTSYWLLLPYGAAVLALAFFIEARGLGPWRSPGAGFWSN